jgi:hypothetical protein
VNLGNVGQLCDEDKIVVFNSKEGRVYNKDSMNHLLCEASPILAATRNINGCYYLDEVRALGSIHDRHDILGHIIEDKIRNSLINMASI